jgi:thiol-disulfide isomerase/thioredoxin
MMITTALLASALLFTPGQIAKPIAPGSPAPPVKVAEWVKGGPFAGFDKSAYTVVEFWATWCPYSREAMPKMSELATKYKGKVPFLAISTWEQGNPDVLVKSYVAEFGAEMSYTVGRDTTDEQMAKAWMETSASELPTAFLVDKKGNIAWIGHPMELEPILAQALTGKLDVEKTKADYLAGLDMKAKEKEFMASLSGIVAAYKQGGQAQALVALDNLKAPLPYLEGEKANNKLGMLAEMDLAKAEAYAMELVGGPKAPAMALVQWVFYLPHTSQGRETIYAPLMAKTYAVLASKHGAKDPTLHLMAAYSFFQLNDKAGAKAAAAAGLVELPKSELKDNKDLKDAFEEIIKKSG